MKTFKELRRKVGQIVGQSIGEGQFKQVIMERDKYGAVRGTAVRDIIISMLEYMEENAADEKSLPIQSSE